MSFDAFHYKDSMSDKMNAHHLVALRQTHFWTQEDLAAASGLSVRTVQRMERGKSASIESWKLVAAAFDVPIDVFTSPPVDRGYITISTRQAAINSTIGCAGGLFGCSLGWWTIMSSTPDFHGAVTDVLPLTAIVTLATAVCLTVPIVQWQRLIR